MDDLLKRKAIDWILGMKKVLSNLPPRTAILKPSVCKRISGFPLIKRRFSVNYTMNIKAFYLRENDIFEFRNSFCKVVEATKADFNTISIIVYSTIHSKNISITIPSSKIVKIYSCHFIQKRD